MKSKQTKEYARQLIYDYEIA